MKNNIGIKVMLPKKKCENPTCPFHGNLKCRGKVFTGVIIASRMQKTVTVELIRKYYIPKYERFEKRRTRIKAHNPECINAKDGDIVKISECRPLSKTKTFVIIENLGQEKGFKEKMEALEEGKKRQEEEKPKSESKENKKDASSQS